MYKQFLYLLFLCSIFVYKTSAFEISLKDYEKSPKTISSVNFLMQKYSNRYYEDTLRDFLKNSRPSRIIGSVGNKNARDYIKKYLSTSKLKNGILSELKFNPDFLWAKKQYQDDFQKEVASKYLPNDPVYIQWQNFLDSLFSFMDKNKTVEALTLSWKKIGKNSSEKIVIFANYDTLVVNKDSLKLLPEERMAGADNNATGVVSLLLFAHVLVELDLPYTVELLFLDAEQFYSLGSKAYLLGEQKEKIIGAINLLMLGYDTKLQDKDKKIGNMHAYIRKSDQAGYVDDKKLADILSNIGKRVRPQVDFKVIDNSFTSSGINLFWQQNIPGVVYTHNWESDLSPHQNSSLDLFETLNLTTAYNSFIYIGSGLIGFLFDIK